MRVTNRSMRNLKQMLHAWWGHLNSESRKPQMYVDPEPSVVHSCCTRVPPIGQPHTCHQPALDHHTSSCPSCGGSSNHNSRHIALKTQRICKLNTNCTNLYTKQKKSRAGIACVCCAKGTQEALMTVTVCSNDHSNCSVLKGIPSQHGKHGQNRMNNRHNSKREGCQPGCRSRHPTL